MLRISHYLMLAAGAAAWLAQPAAARADAAPGHHAGYRHYYYYGAPPAYGYRDVGAILHEVRTSPFYGQFGGDEDAHAAWQYFGPGQRHYFGGWDPRWQ
jgi:hypothetical protein